MATTIVNSKTISQWIYKVGGVEKNVSRAYMNTLLVFKKGVELILPQAVSEINLQSFIEANAPGETSILITNSFTQPRVVTGDLSGLDVVFINNGEIQGVDLNRNAFHATSLIQLINNGWIRGGGGDGGKGGVGKNDTYVTTSSSTQYVFGCGSGYSWGDHDGTNTVTLTWGSKWCNRTTTGTGPLTHDDYSGRFYRSTLQGYSTACQANGNYYSVRRETDVTSARTGGAGGAGGSGQTFDTAISFGQAGSVSSPTGGNTGGAGGSGGNWGVPGVPGSPGGGYTSNGEDGQVAGYAIHGSDNLAANSVQGNIDGTVAANATATATANAVSVNRYTP